MNFKKIGAFIGGMLAISGFAVYWLLNHVEGPAGFIISLLFFLWGPALSAMLVQKFMYDGEMKDFGFRSGRLDMKWLMFSALGPFVTVAGTIGVVFVGGNLMGIPGFGKVGMGAGAVETEALTGLMGAQPFFSHDYGLSNLLFQLQEMLFSSFGVLDTLQMIIFLLIAGVLFLTPMMLGEELGFRGLMLKETQSLGFQGSALVTGGVWGLWAMIPAFMVGYFDLFPLMVSIGSCIAMSFPLAYLSLKCGNIFAPALFRGLMGAAAVLMPVFVHDADELLGSIGGVAGMVFFLFVTYLIIKNDEDFVENYRELSYRPAVQDEED